MSFPFVPKEKVAMPTLPLAGQVELPAKDSALVVVDMQNDFVRPQGALHVPAAAETVAQIQTLLNRAREMQLPIAYTQDSQVEDDPEFAIWPPHCRIGSWGWQIIEELRPEAQDLICPKNRYDGFYGTWLDHFVGHVWRVNHLVLVGTLSNVCVLHTAASAALRWYRVVVPARGISALTAFDQALTLHQINSLYQGTVVEAAKDIAFVRSQS